MADIVGTTNTGPNPDLTNNQAFFKGGVISSEAKTLQGVANRLQGKDNFSIWSWSVKRILTASRYVQLIDKSIPRPPNTSGYHTRWQEASLQVGLWLTSQVSEEVQKLLEHTPMDMEYADDTYAAIEKIVVGQGIVQARVAAMKLATMKRADFATAKDFIRQYRETVDACQRLGVETGPFYSTLILLSNLRADMPNWVDNREYSLTDEDAKNYKWPDFQKLAEDAFIRAEADANPESITAAPYQPRNNPNRNGMRNKNNNNNDAQNNVKNDTQNNYQEPFHKGPKEGDNIEQWVKTWLTRRFKRARDEMCPYCRVGFHDIDKCWYLVPAARIPGWKPRSNIWMYKPEADKKINNAGQNTAFETQNNNNTSTFVAFSALPTPKKDRPWIYDSGAARTVTGDRNDFIDYHEYGPNDEAYKHATAGGGDVTMKGEGTILLRIRTIEGGCREYKTRAYFNPQLPFNLVSSTTARDEMGFYWNSKDLLLRDVNNDIVIGTTRMWQGVPIIDTYKEELSTNTLVATTPELGNNDLEIIAALTKDDIYQAHRRLGHAGAPKIQGILDSKEKIEKFDCDICREAKAIRQVSRVPQNARNLDSNDPAAIWYADVQTVKPQGHGGYNYYLALINGATKLKAAYMLRTKGEAAEKIIQWSEYLKVSTGQYPRCWQIDGGAEFKKAITWCNKNGISCKVTAPRSPEQNGSAERMGGYINGLARAMMLDGGLPKELWPYAIHNAVRIANRLPTADRKDARAPITKWRQHWQIEDPNPPLTPFKIFGCRAWVHIPQEDRVRAEKMNPRARIGYYVGNEGDHGHLYNIWMPKENKIIRSRDVVFDEARVYREDLNNDRLTIADRTSDMKGTKAGETAIVKISTPQTTQSVQTTVEPNPEPQQRQTLERSNMPMGGEPPIRRPETPPDTTQIARTIYQPTTSLRQLEYGDNAPPTTPTLNEERIELSTTPVTPPPRHLMFPEPPRPRRHEMRLDVIQEDPNDEIYHPLHFYQLEIQENNREERIRNLFGNNENVRTISNLPTNNQRPTQQEASTESPDPMITEYYGHNLPIEDLQLAENALEIARRNTEDVAMDIEMTDAQQEPEPEPQRRGPGRPRRNQINASQPSGIRKNPDRTCKAKPGHWREQVEARLLAATDIVEITEELRSHEVPVPQSYKQAIAGPHADRWKAAMQRQIDEITGMKAFDVIPRRQAGNNRILHGKWVYAVKSNKENFVERFKARYVVCGNQQRPGIDFTDSSAPVPSDDAMRMFWTMVAIKKKKCRQVDIVTAYLHAAIKDRKIYMKQPPGFETTAGDDEIWILNQALYGLRQAGHLWFQELKAKLIQMGFQPLTEEPCIYKRGNAYMMVYVDDLQIVDDNDTGINEIQDELSKEFKVKVIGEPAKFLGCAITRNYEAATVTISQNAFTEDLLTEFGMQKSNGAETPIPVRYRTYRKELTAPKSQLTEDQAVDAAEAPTSEYAVLCGSVNWLVTKSRPDIAHAVFRLQRQMKNPIKYDLKTAKTLLRYLQRYRYDLVLGIEPDKGEEVYVDAAHQDLEDGKSSEGYIIYFAGSPVSWGATKQSVVAPSSTVAEFMAFDHAVKEALYIRKLAVAFDMSNNNNPICINTDGDNAVKAIEKVGFSNTLKWIDNRFYFVKDMWATGKIIFRHVDGTENPADGFTKPLPTEEYEAFKKRLRLKRH